MLIENLWHDLMNERYMQVWYYDGPSPKNGPRMVALLDEFGGEIAYRTDPSDPLTWKMAGISHVIGFCELPEIAFLIELEMHQDNDMLNLILVEVTSS